MSSEILFFIGLMSFLLVFLWSVMLGQLVKARREQQRWSARGMKHVSFFTYVEGVTWVMLAMLLGMTVELVVVFVWLVRHAA